MGAGERLKGGNSLRLKAHIGRVFSRGSKPLPPAVVSGATERCKFQWQMYFGCSKSPENVSAVPANIILLPQMF